MLEIIALVLMAQQPFVQPFEMLMEGKASYYRAGNELDHRIGGKIQR